MESGFWKERWKKNQIGFHKEEVHPFLEKEWSKLEVNSGKRVLVPMCGKSNDMLWLLKQGYQVIGVELSSLAVEAFFSENNLKPTIREQGKFIISEIENLQIICGDYFNLDLSLLSKIDAVYDRASIVALPQEMRIDYTEKMASLLASDAKILLVTFNYLEKEMSGPPFSVEDLEVKKLYQDWCEVELLASEDVLEREIQLKSRGISQLHEKVYKVIVR